MMATTVTGTTIGMWLPIMLFFYMGFEHSIVNMFLFPSGLLLGGNFTIGDHLLWNEIPTVIGNLVGGLAFRWPHPPFDPSPRRLEEASGGHVGPHREGHGGMISGAKPC